MTTFTSRPADDHPVPLASGGIARIAAAGLARRLGADSGKGPLIDGWPAGSVTRRSTAD